MRTDSATNENWANEIGSNAYESIAEMVAALECDYDRLAELRDQDELDDYETEELAELEAAAGECKDQDEARQRIEEDALSVLVRSDWVSPGESMTPSEFELLLGTGGPAVRIRGKLDRGEPTRAWLEVQDWGKPWTEYIPADQDVLLTYASCFYYGEE